MHLRLIYNLPLKHNRVLLVCVADVTDKIQARREFIMCLILFSYRPDSNRPLVVAANRDEVHERASRLLCLGGRTNHPAGRDLVAGGTWLGCNREGRFAALTNLEKATPSHRNPGGARP